MQSNQEDALLRTEVRDQFGPLLRRHAAIRSGNDLKIAQGLGVEQAHSCKARQDLRVTKVGIKEND